MLVIFTSIAMRKLLSTLHQFPLLLLRRKYHDIRQDDFAWKGQRRTTRKPLAYGNVARLSLKSMHFRAQCVQISRKRAPLATARLMRGHDDDDGESSAQRKSLDF